MTNLIISALLFILPFLDGGRSIWGKAIIFITPFLLFLAIFPKSKKKTISLPVDIIISLILFLSALFISLSNSLSLSLSLPAFFETLSIILLFNFFLLEEKPNLSFALKTITSAAFFLSLLSLYYLLPFTTPPKEHLNLIYAHFGHNHLAEYLGLILPWILVNFLRRGGGWNLLFFFFTSVLVLTFSRTSLLFFPPVILWALKTTSFKEKKKRALCWTLIPLLWGSLCLLLYLSLTPLGAKLRSPNPSLSWTRWIIKPATFSNRTEYFSQATRAFLKRPFFGWGWGSFKLVSFRFQTLPERSSWLAHNFYLQTLAEGGIFALLSFLAFLLFSLKRIYPKISKKSPHLMGVFLGIILSSLQSTLDFGWHFPAIFLTFFFLVAYGLKANPKKWATLSKNSQSLYLRGLWVLSGFTFLFGVSLILGELSYRKNNLSLSTILYPWNKKRLIKWADFYWKKKPSKREKISKKVANLNRHDPYVHAWLGGKYHLQGDFQKAADEYQEALDSNPLGNYPLYYTLVNIYDRLGDKETKEKVLWNLVQSLEKLKHPNKISGLGFKNLTSNLAYQFAETMYNEEKYGRAFFALTQAIRLDPKVLVRFKPIEMLEKDYLIPRSFHRRLTMLPNSSFGRYRGYYSKPLYKIGLSYSQRGNWREAAIYWQKALELSPDWSYFHIELANLYASQEDFERARKVLKKCLEFEHPKEHCQFYLEKVINKEKSGSPGAEKNKIINQVPNGF